MHSCLVTALVVLGIVSFTTSARAQAEPIRLTYSAPQECSSESAFLHEVTARTARARRAMPNEPARAFAVTLTLETDTVRGRLSITNLDGSQSTREVTGQTCDEVVSALALMTALSIDPVAIVSPGVGSAAQEPSRDGGSDDDSHGPKSSGIASPSGSPPPAQLPFEQLHVSTPPSAALDRSIGVRSEEASPLSRARPRWAIGAGGRGLAGLAPGWGLGGGIFVAVEANPRGHFVPAFRASISMAAASAQFTEAIGTDLVWYLAGFEACPLRFLWSSEVSSSLCAALEGGVLHSGGASTGLQKNEDVYKPWIAPAALGRVTWDVSERWFVEAAAGLTVPLIQYQFYYRDVNVPSVPVYAMPAVGATLGMETGYRFP